MNAGNCVFMLLIEPIHRNKILSCFLFFEYGFIGLVSSNNNMNIAPFLDQPLPKHWHKYIVHFFDKNLCKCKNINSHSNNFPHVTWCLLQYAEIFQTYSKMVVTPIKFANTKVAKPSGQIIAQFDGFTCGEWCGSVKMCCIITKRHSWRFCLFPELLMNFTFHEIYFSVPHNFITYAHLKISISKTKSTVFKFCCQLSSFNFYPPGYRFLTEVTTITTELNYKINASFVVVDKNTKENVPISYLDHIKYFLIFKIQHWFEQHISVTTKKSEYLVIVKNTERNHACDLFVVDGPGMLSKELDSRNGTYKSSTFQCFVKVKKINGGFQSLSYHSHNLTVGIRQHATREAICLISNKQCNFTYPCVASVHTSNFSSSKVTIRNLSYQGFISLDCQYEGLSLLYKQSKELFELLTACDKSNNGRSIYFHSEYILLVLYCYTEYSSISVSTNVQKTHCKPVYVQRCNSEYCFPCLRNLVKTSEINFPKIKEQTLAKTGDGFTFDEQCIVLHIVDSESDNKKVSCEVLTKGTHHWKCRHQADDYKGKCARICPSHVHIVPYMPGKNMILKYQIKAFLKYGPYVGNEYVEFQGRILSVNSKRKVKYYKKILSAQHKQQDTLAKIAVEVQTKWRSLFAVTIQSQRWSQNWVDVQIEVQNKSFLCISEQLQATYFQEVLKTTQQNQNETLYVQLLNPVSYETKSFEAMFCVSFSSFFSFRNNKKACHSFLNSAKLFQRTLITTQERTHVFSLSDLINNPLVVLFPNWDKNNQTKILLKAAWIPNQFHWFLNKLQLDCVSYMMETRHCAGTASHVVPKFIKVK